MKTVTIETMFLIHMRDETQNELQEEQPMQRRRLNTNQFRSVSHQFLLISRTFQRHAKYEIFFSTF